MAIDTGEYTRSVNVDTQLQLTIRALARDNATLVETATTRQRARLPLPLFGAGQGEHDGAMGEHRASSSDNRPPGIDVLLAEAFVDKADGALKRLASRLAAVVCLDDPILSRTPLVTLVSALYQVESRRLVFVVYSLLVNQCASRTADQLGHWWATLVDTLHLLVVELAAHHHDTCALVWEAALAAARSLRRVNRANYYNDFVGRLLGARAPQPHITTVRPLVLVLQCALASFRQAGVAWDAALFDLLLPSDEVEYDTMTADEGDEGDEAAHVKKEVATEESGHLLWAWQVGEEEWENDGSLVGLLSVLRDTQSRVGRWAVLRLIVILLLNKMRRKSPSLSVGEAHLTSVLVMLHSVDAAWVLQRACVILPVPALGEYLTRYCVSLAPQSLRARQKSTYERHKAALGPAISVFISLMYQIELLADELAQSHVALSEREVALRQRLAPTLRLACADALRDPELMALATDPSPDVRLVYVHLWRTLLLRHCWTASEKHGPVASAEYVHKLKSALKPLVVAKETDPAVIHAAVQLIIEAISVELEDDDNDEEGDEQQHRQSGSSRGDRDDLAMLVVTGRAVVSHTLAMHTSWTLVRYFLSVLLPEPTARSTTSVASPLARRHTWAEHQCLLRIASALLLTRAHRVPAEAGDVGWPFFLALRHADDAAVVLIAAQHLVEVFRRGRSHEFNQCVERLKEKGLESALDNPYVFLNYLRRNRA